MKFHRKEDVRKQSIRARLETVRLQAEEFLELHPGSQPGFWVKTDLMEEVLGWKSIGGSQLRRINKMLEEMGFELSKMWDPELNVIAWFACLKPPVEDKKT